MKNKVIIDELKKIFKEKELMFVVSEDKYDIQYDVIKISNYDKEISFNKKISKVDELTFDFLKPIENKNKKIILPNEVKLNLLVNLLGKELLPIEQIKKISFDDFRPYRGWHEVKQLFMYNKENISSIVRNYVASISNSDVNDIVNRITNTCNNNTFEDLIVFTKNHIEKIKDNHINFVRNFISNSGKEEDINSFNSFIESKSKISKDASIFEEKENKFEYLNLNVKLFMEKYYFSKPGGKMSTVEEYEKIVKDTISFLKTHKKKLYFESMYLENRATTKNEFLINIEVKENFNKEIIKKIFLGYVNLYIEEIKKLTDDDGQFIFKANHELKNNKEKISNFIFLNLELPISNKEKMKKMKI